MAHPNEELIRKGYEAFGSGDMATLDELFADDIVWHAPGRNQLSGDYRGKQEVFAQFQKVMELTGGTFKLEIHDVLANDEHAVVLVRATGQIEGRTLDDNGVQVLHISDGKIAEQWLHPGDTYAGDEFWGKA
jgi:ketosteroid isomerase-like protein